MGVGGERNRGEGGRGRWGREEGRKEGKLAYMKQVRNIRHLQEVELARRGGVHL
jgi:hypothetical protein